MLKSIISMIAVRGISLIFPLLLIPLQLKLLGISQYGEYNVLFAMSAIGAIVINYGFDYSASSDIARTDGVITKISYIFSCCFYCKLINFMIVSVVMFFYFYVNDDVGKFYILSVFLLSQVLIPIYVFQGMRKMEFLIYNTIFLNVSFLILTILFIFFAHGTKSTTLFLVYSIINIIAALQMLYYLYRRYRIRLDIVSSADVIDQFKSGSWIFLSRIMSSGLSQWSIIILSTALNPAILGVYTLADKLVRASNSFFYAVQQATYPYFCNKGNEGNLTSIMCILSFVATIAVILLYFMKDLVVFFFPVLTDYYYPLIIMFTSLVPMSISGMIGVNYLLANDHNKTFTIILGVAAIFNIAMLYFFVVNDSITRAAMVMLMTESLVAAMMLISMWCTRRQYGS